MKKVYIENSDFAYDAMFTNEGYKVVDNPADADLICFTGGADISPSLYGRWKHPTTHTHAARDEKCLELWEYAQANKRPCVGICRGSQFLHAMNGGELVQDCNNHLGNHKATVTWMPNTEIIVSSTHHQMMYSQDVGEVVLYTDRATRKVTQDDEGQVVLDLGYDIESMVYPDTNSMSFQPHPEFVIRDDSLEDCKNAFFFIINNYLEI